MSPESTTPLPEIVRAPLAERTSELSLELPMLPDTASRVMGLCTAEDCDVRELAELIERDPSLAGHVLRISNSAAFAPNEAIVSLQQAVTRLGFSVLSEIAVGVALRGQVFRVPGFDKTIRLMWMHSAAAGAFAKDIARTARRNVEGAFLCGLLHDVGKPIVLTNVLDVCKQARVRPNKPIVETALEEFHTTVGAMLVERWGLAPWVVAAAEHHHRPEEAGAHEVEANVTNLADALSHWALSTRDVGDPRTLPSVAALDLYDDDMVRIMAGREAVLELAAAFA